MSILDSLCKIGRDCAKAVKVETDIFKDEVCGGKSIIECAKASAEYREMKDNWSRLISKKNNNNDFRL